jgi:hypothetical protein
MSVKDLKAIDTHAHFGIWERDMSAENIGWMSGDPEKVLRRARMANIRLSIVSALRSLVPRHGGDPIAGNEESERIIPAYDSLRWWVVIDPLKPGTYDQADRMLKLPSCVGIKIHPDESKVICDPFLQFKRLNQTDHEVDLVENLLEKKGAKASQGAITWISPAVEIVLSVLIRFLQMLEIYRFFPCETARQCPKPFSVEP